MSSKRQLTLSLAFCVRKIEIWLKFSILMHVRLLAGLEHYRTSMIILMKGRKLEVTIEIYLYQKFNYQ